MFAGTGWDFDELITTIGFPKVGNGNGNEIMRMGGNRYTKVIPAYL